MIVLTNNTTRPVSVKLMKAVIKQANNGTEYNRLHFTDLGVAYIAAMKLLSKGV